MTKEQVRFLRNRLEEANRIQQHSYKEEKRPKWYREMERKMEAWRMANYKHRQRHYAAVKKRYDAAKTALLFHDPQKALAAVEKFESGR